ncbi:unnamed protein product [Sphagnum jensenii]|uniref:RRM domain-containing protein n=1 Tax=Sphagnum jensenii TaxID=128206 RepID=A0ABP1BDU5_9BRYO
MKKNVKKKQQGQNKEKKNNMRKSLRKLFKSLFGGYSGSLSLFTNNPYQRKKNGGDDAFVKPALKNDDRSERKSKKTPLKKDVDVAAERLENGSIAHRKKEKKKEEEKKGEKKKSSRGELEGGFVPASKKESNGNEEVVMQESVEKKECERKLLRTIFVGNLPITVKPKHLVREFSKYGSVENARLRSVPLVDTKLPRKAAVITKQLSTSHTSLNAYIVFEDASSAKAALTHNMSEFQGRHLRVDMATAPRKDGNLASNNPAEYDCSRSIFVGNIPFDVEDEDLYAVFGTNLDPEMGVEAIRVPRDPQTSIGKGFGFVLFKSKAGASAALAKKGWNLKERKLRVVRMGTQQLRRQQSQAVTLNARDPVDNKTASRFRIGQKGSSPHARGPLPWEGARSIKSDGKPGKRTVTRPEARRSGPGGGPRASNTSSSTPAPRTRSTKRPAVLARKQAALLVKSGGLPTSKQKNPNNAGAKGKKKHDMARNRGPPKEKKGKKLK